MPYIQMEHQSVYILMECVYSNEQLSGNILME